MSTLPTSDLVAKFIMASSEAIPHVEHFITTTRKFLKTNSIPRKSLFKQQLVHIEVAWLALLRNENPLTTLSLMQSMLGYTNLLASMSINSLEFSNLCVDNIQKIIEPYTEFALDCGPSIITMQLNLQELFNNPKLSSLLLAMQYFNTIGSIDESFIDVPENIAYVADMIRNVTPAILIMSFCMCIAIVHANSKVKTSGAATQVKHKAAKVAGAFIDSARQSADNAQKLVDILKREILGGKQNINRKLVNSAFMLKAAALKLQSSPTAVNYTLLIQTLFPFANSLSDDISANVIRILNPLIDFTSLHSKQILDASNVISALTSNPELATIIFTSSCFISENAFDPLLINFPVKEASAASAIQTLTPTLFSLVGGAALTALYLQQPRTS